MRGDDARRHGFKVDVSVIALDPRSAAPPFEQIRTRIAQLVNDGQYPPGTRLPTVRKLAADLRLAPNTVARAYRELEADGVIQTQGRHGTYVRGTAWASSPESGGLPTQLDTASAAYTAAARRAGLSLPEAVRVIERRWSA